MKQILFVSRKGRSKDMLIQLLESDPDSAVTAACTEADAVSLMEKTEYDLILINSPLEGNPGADLAVYAAEKYAAGVLLATRNKYADIISQKVGPYGVLVVGKPIVKAFFSQALKFADVTRQRVRTLKEENIHLQLALEEMKIINRAKCVLIQYLSMSEAQAHKYIEKQAMDMRQPKHHIARQILKAYEQEGINR